MTYELERIGPTGLRVGLGKFSADVTPTTRDTALVLGQRYVYRMTSIDTAGNRSKMIVDSLWFRDPTPPPAPRNTLARATADGVTISWERVVDDQLVGYMVYRSEIPTGVFTPVTTKPVKELTYTAKGAPATFYYVVRAVDVSGNESISSPAVRPPAR
jgi:fibronectin type 3 domain-containing protein